STRTHDYAVLLKSHAAADQVHARGRDRAVADHQHAGGGVVGDRVLDLDLPVADPRVDDLEAGLYAIGRRQYIRRGEAGAAEVPLQNEGDLALRARLEEAVGGHGVAVAKPHLRGEVAEVGLIDAERLLHDLARHADLLADVPNALARELPCHD